jgi:hypothetical protein
VLIDDFLPVFDIAERHAVIVETPGERAYAAARGVDLSRSRTVRGLFALRGIPLLLRGRRTQRSMRLDDLTRSGFVLLAEDPGTEVVLGIVGRFWTPRGGVLRVTPDEFQEFDRPGLAKAVWNFRVEPRGDERCVVATETRVRCTDEASRRKFVLYWAAIGAFSGLIRRRALATIKADAEGHSP